MSDPEVTPPRNQTWNDLSVPEYPVSSNAWSLIMLEAWRRGIRVEVLRDRRYILESPEKSIPFRLNRLTTPEAAKGAEICNNKHEAKQYFQERGLPTPLGSYFRAPFQRERIIAAAREIGYPLCLKAANWSKGKGVFPGITNDAQLNRFLDVLIDDLQSQSLIIEENFDGEDFRFFVVGDKVSGVIQRVAANVEGDGKSTIAELIAEKNRLRSQNPYLKGALIKVDEEVEYMLESQGVGLDSILPAAKILYLREKSNASAGGDSIDVTHLVSSESKRIAVEAIKAIPGLEHGGVDLLIRHPFTEYESATLIEINQSAEMGLHLYPAFGEPTYPPGDIIDHYFPDYAPNSSACSWYFDLKSIFEIIRSGVAERVVVSPIPKVNNMVCQRLVVAGNKLDSSFRRWLVAQAGKLSLHGTYEKYDKRELELRLWGRKRELEKLVAQINRNDSPDGARVIKNEKITKFRLVPGLKVISNAPPEDKPAAVNESRGGSRTLSSDKKTRLKLPFERLRKLLGSR